jgi:predicted enzyme related to lactoylglutathione lyase
MFPKLRGTGHRGYGYVYPVKLIQGRHAVSGRVVHFEVPFDDGDRARSFYKQVFDWNVQEVPEMDYTIVMSGPTTDDGTPSEPGFINGGMLQRSQSSSTGPVITLAVDDIEAALKRIEDAGGSTVVGKSPVGDMGFAAYFKDTEGNVMGLWENAG